MTGVLVGALLAVIAAAGALGSGDRQAWEYLVKLEQRYATNQNVPWSSLRTVVRSDTSADDKLTAIIDLLGHIDTRHLPRFKEAAQILSDLQSYFRIRYQSLLISATYIFAVLVASPFLPEKIETYSRSIEVDELLLLLVLLPMAWLLYVLYRIGKLETAFYNSYESLEELS